MHRFHRGLHLTLGLTMTFSLTLNQQSHLMVLITVRYCLKTTSNEMVMQILCNPYRVLLGSYEVFLAQLIASIAYFHCLCGTQYLT